MSRASFTQVGAANQSGAALIVSLIILAVVTILGITSMQGSNTELKLAASMRDRGVAFEAAEAALVIVEEQLAQNPPPLMNLYSNCTGTGCYNKTCDGGLCFDGDYRLGYSEYQCEVANYANKKRRVDFWSDKDLNVWQDSSKHQTLLVDSVKTRVKYITEFLCFVASEGKAFDDSDSLEDNGAPLFRVTVLAEGNGARASVALQSTYKILNGH